MVEPQEFTSKKEAILYSAFHIFTEKGYHQATVSEIAEYARVGKGTVYEYFGSKEEILRGVIQEGLNYYLQELNKSLESIEGSLGKLRYLLKRHVELTSQNQQFKQLIFHNFGIMTEQFHQFLNEQRSNLIEKLKQILKEAVETKEIPPLDLEVGARLLLGSIVATDSDMGYLSDEQVDEMIAIIEAGLKR